MIDELRRSARDRDALHASLMAEAPDAAPADVAPTLARRGRGATLNPATRFFVFDTPPDMERLWGITGGNIMQGSMSLSSMFSFRPVAGYANYRTPVAGLYLCGSGSHPGGGVMGAPGHNAAQALLKDGAL